MFTVTPAGVVMVTGELDTAVRDEYTLSLIVTDGSHSDTVSSLEAKCNPLLFLYWNTI